MKRASTVLGLSVMIVLFLNNAAGQSNGQQRQFPTLPERPSVPPTASQLQAWGAFQSSHPGWKVRWDKETGAPASLLGMPIEVTRGTPEVIARKFLLMNRDILRMKTGLSNLMVNKIAPMRRATHVVFTQSYAGIPVEGAVYAVHMTKENKVYLANGDYFDSIEVNNTEPSIPLDEAINTAKDDLGIGLIMRGSASGNLVILPYGADFLLTWKVTIPADEPSGEWVYFISATDGTILTGYNSADYAEATGSVYDRHPGKGPVVNRTLTNLSGTGNFLNGTYVHAFNEDDQEAFSKDNWFVYGASNTHFDEVMAYYHANRFQDIYLDNIGYPYLNFPDLIVKVDATVHYGSNWNNAQAIFPNILRFGDGDGVIFNDLAKEDDVIYHEYQHLVTEYTTYDGLDGGWEEDAMDEAFSDYFGASFAGSPLIGEYVTVGSGSLRNLDNSYTMSDWNGPNYPNSQHEGSQVFSGALWDMRQQLGQNIADILSFEGLDNLDGAAPDFQDGRDAVVAADYALYAGAHVCTIKDVFGAREIGAPGYSVSISGPTELDYGENGNWTATIYCGSGSYEWRYRDNGGAWSGVVSTSSSYSRTMPDINYFELKVEVTDGSRYAEDTHAVYRTYGGLPRISTGTEETQIPKAYGLAQNHPNPFNPTTTIRYELPEPSSVTLVVYDILGNEINRWTIEREGAGYKQVVWGGTDEKGQPVSASIYIYRLTARSMESDKRFTQTRKMVLLR